MSGVDRGKAHPRVVTLLPSATEVVYALGVEPVATSHECDHPPAAADKPAVNRSRIDADASPGTINDQVLRADRDGGVYEINLDALAEADPDVVISQGVCDVCAVDEVLVEDALETLGLDCEVVTTDPHSLSDVLDDVERIGRVLGRETRARELRAELEARINAVATRTPPADTGPTVVVLDWPAPVMVAGHWVPGMVETLGATYGLEAPGGRSRPREWTAVRRYDPEVLVLAPCGFDLAQTLEHRAELTDRPGWTDLTAVRHSQAYAMDGHAYVNRPGPRLVDTLEYFAGLLYPDRFDPPPRSVASAIDEPVDRGSVAGERATEG